MLTDAFGRTATDVRISLTDRCSLRCTYCMPAGGMAWLPNSTRLTDPEFARVAALFVGLGVRTIRLTGGEPLVHPTVPQLVRQLRALVPSPEISLTTNAVALADQAAELADAGLSRINVSLDTLDRDRFAALTRRDRLPDVLAGIAAADRAGLHPMKINTVLLRGQNDDEAPRMLQWALEHGYQLRFIEHMPIDGDRTWSRTAMVSAAETLALLGEAYTLEPRPARAHAPAEEFEVLAGPGVPSTGAPARLGIIASVTRPFCRDCDRLRLTADGQLRTCLFAHTETDLRTPLRADADDAHLARLIVDAVARKPAGHGIGTPEFRQPARSMSAIGG